MATAAQPLPRQPAHTRARKAPLPLSLACTLASEESGLLLVVRSRANAADGRPRILVAVEDDVGAAHVVAVAGAIAAACDGYVQLIHVAESSYSAHTRHRLAELSTELIALTGAEPVVDVLRGVHVATAIADFARRSSSSLLVVGRRG